MKSRSEQIHHFALPVLVLLLTLIVLFFGLRPKSQLVGNNVEWLPLIKALRFNKSSLAYVDSIQLFEEIQQSDGFTIQLAITPANLEKKGFRPIFMLHDGSDRNQLTVWHWGASLIVMNGDDYDYTKKRPRISVNNALVRGESTFITITSSEKGTGLFIKDKLVREVKNLQLSIPNGGKGPRLILGNSVYGKHGWDGNIYSLSLHRTAFSPETVKRHYQEWQRDTNLHYDPADYPVFLYSFNECENHTIQEQTGRNPPLVIPPKLVVFKKVILSPPWHNFAMSKSFISDALINFFGFVPLGTAICFWLRHSHSLSRGHETLMIVMFCFLLSLFMEFTQAWLPRRASSQVDLLLNTLGAWFGILLANVMTKYRRENQ